MAVLERLWMMGLQGCVVILFVLVVRLFLKRYPKGLSYCLWALVGMRLLCPVFVESKFSLQPEFTVLWEMNFLRNSQENLTGQENVENKGVIFGETLTGKQENGLPQTDIWNAAGEVASKKPDSTENFMKTEQETTQEMFHEMTQGMLSKTEQKPGQEKSNTVLAGGQPGEIEGLADFWEDLFVVKVWCSLYLLGMLVAAMIYAVQYLRIHKKMALAVKDGEAWLCEQISSPFVMGVFRPRIILPYGLEEEERCHIIRHEKMHLQHRDTLVRLLGVVCTILHWWNPFVWLAVHIMNQDMEMFCDEAVLRGATAAEKKAYARTLVAFSIKQSGFSFGLAFGESNTEQQVKNIIEEKHCSRIVITVVALLMIVCMAAFLTVPNADVFGGTDQEEKAQAEDSVVEEKERVQMFSRSDVLLVEPVQEYGFDFMKRNGTAASVAGTAGGSEVVWHTVSFRGAEFHYVQREDATKQEAELWSYAIVSEEYSLLNGIKVGMSKEELLEAYPAMAVMDFEGNFLGKEVVGIAEWNSSTYPHGRMETSGQAMEDSKTYFYWHDQFEYCMLAEISAENSCGRPVALALMMREDKVAAITFFCQADGIVRPSDWDISVSDPWSRESALEWKPVSYLSGAEAESASYETAMKKGYTDALEALYYEHTLPDGTYIGDDLAGFDISDDKFAVYDIDKDGKDELCILHAATYGGSVRTMIYEYKPETGMYHEEVMVSPHFKAYDNGLLAVQLSRNHSRAAKGGRELWPYYLYCYNTELDTYELMAEVEGWDRHYTASDREDFPAAADKDRDGMVYLVNSEPLDAAEYELWLEKLLGEAAGMESTAGEVFSYQKLTEENIRQVFIKRE